MSAPPTTPNLLHTGIADGLSDRRVGDGCQGFFLSFRNRLNKSFPTAPKRRPSGGMRAYRQVHHTCRYSLPRRRSKTDRAVRRGRRCLAQHDRAFHYLIFIMSFSESMPTANAEDPCQSRRCLKTRLTKTLPTATPSTPIPAPRRSPSECAEKLLKIDTTVHYHRAAIHKHHNHSGVVRACMHARADARARASACVRTGGDVSRSTAMPSSI